MKNNKILRQLIFLVLICAFTIVINLIYAGSDDISNIHTEPEVSEEWQCSINGEDLGLTDLKDTRFPILNRGDELVIEAKLPNTLTFHPVLKLYSIHSIVSVYIDGRMIYEYGRTEYVHNELVGYGYHYIPLYATYAGKDIVIDFQVTEDNAFSSLETPVLAIGDYVQRDFMVENRVRTGIIMFLILFGIVVTVVALIYSLHDISMLRLAFAGLFSICIGWWSLCNTNIMGMFSYNLQTKTFLEFGTLYLAPTFLFAYFYPEVKKEGKIRWIVYNVILWLQVIFSVVSWMLQLTGLVHFPDMLRCCHVLMLLMILFLVIRFLIDMFKGRVHDTALIYGFEFLAVFVIFDLFRFNLYKFLPFFNDDHYVSLVYVGVLFFVITMLIDFGTKYLRGVYKKIEDQTLEKLAYTDYLTGLSNRRSLEDLMDDIDTKGSNFAVIGYDLNDLKKVNDTLGHEEGDRYIKEFAGALMDTFKDIGLSGRSGGDEFVTILPNGRELDLEGMIDKLNNKISLINEKNRGWTMSVAYGIARAGDAGAGNIREAAKLADERMYKCKKEMKKNR